MLGSKTNPQIERLLRKGTRVPRTAGRSSAFSRVRNLWLRLPSCSCEASWRSYLIVSQLYAYLLNREDQWPAVVGDAAAQPSPGDECRARRRVRLSVIARATPHRTDNENHASSHAASCEQARRLRASRTARPTSSAAATAFPKPICSGTRTEDKDRRARQDEDPAPPPGGDARAMRRDGIYRVLIR